MLRTFEKVVKDQGDFVTVNIVASDPFGQHFKVHGQHGGGI